MDCAISQEFVTAKCDDESPGGLHSDGVWKRGRKVNNDRSKVALGRQCNAMDLYASVVEQRDFRVLARADSYVNGTMLVAIV